MIAPRRRWSFGLRMLLGVFAVCGLLLLILMAHGVATGIVVPYPDPTPEQAAYERLHGKISDWLFGLTALAWAFGLLWLLLLTLRTVGRRVSQYLAGRPPHSSTSD